MNRPLVLRDVLMHPQPHPLTRPNASRVDVAISHADPQQGEPPSSETRAAELEEAAYARGFAAGAAHERSAQAQQVEVESCEAVEQGRRTGLEQGLARAAEEIREARERARREAHAEYQESNERLASLLAATSAATRVEIAQHRQEAEDDLVALAHEALCRLLAHQAATPEVVREMVRALVKQHAVRPPIDVHLHPDDFTAVSAMARVPGDAWEWVADPSVALGGVILCSPHGSFDARLDSQFESLHQALREVRRQRMTGSTTPHAPSGKST